MALHNLRKGGFFVPRIAFKEIMKSTEKYTQILLPGGEWLPSILEAFKRANLELETPNPRCYRYTLVEQAMPIVFDVVRSWDVPDIANDPDSNAKIGLTGSDILEEKNRLYGTYPFTLLDLVPSAPQAILYLGTTPNYPGDRDDELNLRNSTVYTTYPNLAAYILRRYEQENITIKSLRGKIEGLWRLDKKNWAIIDIATSGNTALENQITQRRILRKPKVLWYEGTPFSSIDSPDRERFNDLKELMYLALRGKDENEY